MKQKFVSLGKEIDPNGLYNPKPSTSSIAPMNENTGANSNFINQSRPFAQSVRGNPPLVSQQSVVGTLKSTKTQIENRRSNFKIQTILIFYSSISFQ
jgi:hypothetical protein